MLVFRLGYVSGPSGNQDGWRSLFINAARRAWSSSFITVNFIASPRLGSTRFTTASALICPSGTRNSRSTVEPTPLDICVSTSRPPKLIFRTREMSSRPAQRQSTHTLSRVSIREVNLLEGEANSFSMCHHRLRSFQKWRNTELRGTLRAGVVSHDRSREAEGRCPRPSSRLRAGGQQRPNIRPKYQRLQQETGPRGTAASQDASHQEPVKSHGISMQKVANAREHHRQIQAVRGGNYIRVTNRASGLDHGSRACFRRLLDSIGKGEKRIGSHDASLQ